MGRKKQPQQQPEVEREEVLANQLQRLILACEREFTGEIGRMALKEITEESRAVLYPPEDETTETNDE